MIESVTFKNFKVLRDTTLPLGRFTLIVGPNGSGKSTALQGLDFARSGGGGGIEQVASAGLQLKQNSLVEVLVAWDGSDEYAITRRRWHRGGTNISYGSRTSGNLTDERERILTRRLQRTRVFSLDARALARAVKLVPQMELGPNGSGLAVVLDRLRDQAPERFEALNVELRRWLPEFDRVLFDTLEDGHRVVNLRTHAKDHSIGASDLSQGTLLALAMLTLAYLPDPPPLICFEEPDRGIHPRLLRDVRDALYRLAYPENCEETRAPVQVIATTHSPYMLDLFRDHPEEIVIANKSGLEASFQRLSDHPDIDEILQDAPLGDVWYSGILGGVPAEQ